MNKIIYVFIVLLLTPFFAFSKGIKLQLQGGLGTYAMTDMKLFDSYMLNQITIPLKQTENFPAYWFYQGSLLVEINNELSFGPMYAFHSTGSRHSLADYSGKYYFDNLVQAHSVGLSFEYLRTTGTNLKWGAYLDGGMNFSKMQFTQHLELTDVDDEFTNDNFAKETSYFAEPGIRLAYPLKIIEPGFHLGYWIPVSGKGFKDDKSGDFLYLPNGNKLKSGWNGLRIGLSLTIRLNKKN
ncbi:hypothetical protein OU798_00390 [Prolixibacteraceae bacterium Z1-6]|uniref:Uncharacterized protein n=1 Tax=Draconibacterium aestuarii TaxID=2998507 RepID=A0A9X3F1B2_9BACT|nr:hypothetical protein [Prolixibacteraceae bacterium Z1-6]